MPTLGDMIVKIVGENAEFDSAVDKSERKYAKFQNTLKKGGATLTKFVTLPLLAAAAATVKFASDAEETAAKFGTAFRDVRKEADETAKNLARNYGLSNQESQRLLAGTGDLLKGFGATGAEALQLSDKVQKLAVDLASYNNIQGGGARASEIITRAMLGEREALTSLGTKVSEEDVKNRLLAKGMEDLTGKALLLAKAQAVLELVTEQSGDAMGDFARTSDSFANQLKILKGRAVDLASSFGEQLLPIATKLLGTISDMFARFADLSDETKRFILISGGIAAALGPGLLALSKMITAVKVLIPLMRTLAGPAGLIAAAVIGFGVLVGQYIKWKKEQQANIILLNKNNEILNGTKIAINAVTTALGLESDARTNKLRLLRAEQNLLLNMELDALEFAERAAAGEASFVNAAGRRIFMTQQEIDANKKAVAIHEKRVQLLGESVDLIDEAIRKNEISNRVLSLVPDSPGAGTQEKKTPEKLAAEAAEAAEKRTAALLAEIDASRALSQVEMNRLKRQIELEAELAAAVEANRVADQEAFVADKQLKLEESERFFLADEMRNARVVEARKALEEAETQLHAEGLADRKKLDDEAAAHKKNQINAGFSLASGVSQAITGFQSAQYAAELQAAEGNEARIKQIKRRQAQDAKLYALFDIGLKTAMAIMGFMGSLPPNVPGAVAAGILGAVQAAFVLAKPLPALAQGGIIPARQGGTPFIGGEAGVPEGVFPLDKLPEILATIPDASGGTGENMIHLQVNMDSDPILEKVFPATQNGRILIDARAVVN